MSKLILGIELGSTRIKSVLIDDEGSVLTTGAYEWENELVDGHWSYSLENVKIGIQSSYKELIKKYGKPIEKLDAIGISAMMHGYLAFDENWNLLEPFRTWRDTTTSEAQDILTKELKFNFPQRWSATHYYQAVLNKEKSVGSVCHLQTLAGYVHFLLTGENVLGADDASGMFPLLNNSWDHERAKKYNELAGCDIEKLLPTVLFAGENAGTLTEEGAKYLDPSGALKPGALLCPPEGDMGTGMIATNSVLPRTANVSSGTAANMTIVLEKPLKNYYKEIDIIATPDGHPAALVHTNNCTTEINEWVNLFDEVLNLFDTKIDKNELYTKLFKKSLESDENVGNLVGYNYLAGEPIAHTNYGAPLIVRPQDGKLTLANFMQMQIYSAISTLSLGMDILKDENVKIDSVTGHGGFYKTDKIGQIATSAVLNAPVTIMNNAGEGGAWGIALLARYLFHTNKTLNDYLKDTFKNSKKVTIMANEEDKKKCQNFLKNYRKYLEVEQKASEATKC